MKTFSKSRTVLQFHSSNSVEKKNIKILYMPHNDWHKLKHFSHRKLSFLWRYSHSLHGKSGGILSSSEKEETNCRLWFWKIFKYSSVLQVHKRTDSVKPMFLTLNVADKLYTLPDYTVPRIQFMYSQKWNCAASFPIPTFMYLWMIYIFPGLVCLFGCSKIGRPILKIYKSLIDP
jgi:hypothetical protein